MNRNSKNDEIAVVSVSAMYFVLYILQYTDNIFGNFSEFPQLMLAATVCAGMFFGDKYGAIFGFVIGAAVDAVSAGTVSYNTVIMLLIGYFCGVAVEYFINNNFKSVFLVMLAAVIVYFFGIYALNGFNSHLFKNHTFHVAVITYIFSIPLYAAVWFIVNLRKNHLRK